MIARCSFLFTDEASDMLDAIVGIADEGSAAGMSDEEIDACIRDYIARATQRMLH